jgi:hypothetical protein
MAEGPRVENSLMQIKGAASGPSCGLHLRGRGCAALRAASDRKRALAVLGRGIRGARVQSVRGAVQAPLSRASLSPDHKTRQSLVFAGLGAPTPGLASLRGA